MFFICKAHNKKKKKSASVLEKKKNVMEKSTKTEREERHPFLDPDRQRQTDKKQITRARIYKCTEKQDDDDDDDDDVVEREITHYLCNEVLQQLFSLSVSLSLLKTIRRTFSVFHLSLRGRSSSSSRSSSFLFCCCYFSSPRRLVSPALFSSFVLPVFSVSLLALSPGQIHPRL